MLGRTIGLVFIIPGAYFAYRGYMTRAIKIRTLIVSTMIGCQGLLGWYMVKSGLDAALLEDAHAVPRVSQYRLASHLGSAFIIYSVMVTTGLGILRANSPQKSLDVCVIFLTFVDTGRFSCGPAFKPIQNWSTCYYGSCIYHCFIWSLRGWTRCWYSARFIIPGLIYNEFPYMGTGLVPSDMWAFSDRIENPVSLLRNLFENPAAAQFNHRVLVYIIILILRQ
jgi:cytochrome c oxidase assembly protein subunit 15